MRDPGNEVALQQEFLSPRFRPLLKLQTNVVYKISCAECPWGYIGVLFKRGKSEEKGTHLTCKNMQNSLKYSSSRLA